MARALSPIEFMLRRYIPLLMVLVAASGCKDTPTGPGPASKHYQVGEHHEFNVNAENACAEPDFRTGRVIAVTERAIVVADTANPRGAGTFTEHEYAAFGSAFDEIVWPSNVKNFGDPHDVDQNGRVILFFTRAVNELTPTGQKWFIGGFFFSRDLFPKQETRDFKACSASNEAEILYMLVPDPRGDVNGNVRTKGNELRGTVSVLAHEFQHLINAARRLFVVRAGGTGWQEETWLNEGLSHIAEELLGYSTSSLSPRQNIDSARLSASTPERTAFGEYQYANANRYAAYLEKPEAHSLMGPDSLATRGATWSFLRYAADRRGGDETALWRKLVTTQNSGIENLQTVLGVDPIDWVNDWIVSVGVDDAADGLSANHRQASWNFRSIFPWVRDANGRPLHGFYPLQTHTLVSGQQRNIGISGSSAAYIRFAVAPMAVAELRMGSSTAGCTSGSTVSLAVGQAHTLASDGAATLCVAGGASGGEFMMIPFSTSTALSERAFSVRASSVITPLDMASQGDRTIITALRSVRAEQTSDAAAVGHWKSELRARETNELGPLIRSGGAPVGGASYRTAAASGSSTAFRITVVRIR